MTDQPLATLRDIAHKLQLPESTVRYYRDAFAHHLATVGSGRRRRYPPEAVATLRLIALRYQEGRTREQIEQELAEIDGADGDQHRRHPWPQPPPAVPYAGFSVNAGALLTELMEGERERRQAMWQIAREMVRLGEAVDRQQATLIDMSERLTALTERALPAGAPADRPAESSPDPAPSPPVDTSPPINESHPSSDPLRELDALREELASEKELVERLRTSKLEIERRAAKAEERAGERDSDPGVRRSVFSRLLSRDQGVR